MIDNISGVILAGGANSRFNGLVKANIVIGGRTIISRTSDLLREIFKETIIVTNTPEEFTECTEFKIVADEILNKGPLGGIHAALKATSGEAVFVFAGDMPFIDKEIVTLLLDTYSGQSCDILIPKSGIFIEPLHSIYSKAILQNLERFLEVPGNNAVKEFIKGVNTCFMPLENSEKTRKAFTNINYPEDLPELKKLFNIN
jgi:molybdopterin-guanine dinucleotide biosynthesis protein A